MKVLKLVLLLLIIASPVMWAQFGPFVFRINGGAGYTFIDLSTALDYNWDDFRDWDQLNVKVSLQSLFFHISPFSVGVEVGYNILYYYYVIIAYTEYQPIYREATVYTINVSAVGAYSLSDIISILSSAGVYFFENGTTFGFKGSLVFRLPITENIAIPFALVGEVIFGDGIPITAGATVGFEYTLDI
jgi:hypothetical protein